MADGPASKFCLVKLIELLDGLDALDSDHYLDMHWYNAGGGGDEAVDMKPLVRALARDALGQFSPEEIGDEMLRRIDRRVTE